MTSELKNETMQRIRTIYLMRRFSQPAVIRTALFAVLFIVTGFFVSLPHIFSNAVSSAQNAHNEYGFLTSAFSHTAVLIKIVTLILLGIGAVLFLDIFKVVRKSVPRYFQF